MDLVRLTISGAPPVVLRFRPGLNVVTVDSGQEREELVEALRSVLTGNASQASATALIGVDPAFELTAAVGRTIALTSGKMDPVLDASVFATAQERSARPTPAHPQRGVAMAMVAALDTIAIVSDGAAVPQLPTSAVETRLQDVTKMRANLEQGHHSMPGHSVAEATVALQTKQTQLARFLRLCAQVDGAHGEVVDADAAATRRFAGQTSGRVQAAGDNLTGLLAQLGYETHSAYSADANVQRVRRVAEVATAERNVVVVNERRIAAVDQDTAELAQLRSEESVLRVRLGITATLDNVDRLGSGAMPLFKLQRQLHNEVGRSLELLLQSQGAITSAESAPADARRWLFARPKALEEPAAATDDQRSALAAACLRGRLKQHAAVEAIDGLPLVIDDVLSGEWSASRAELLPMIVEAGRGQQILYVTEDASLAGLVNGVALVGSSPGALS